jgi:hypothetical protein
MPGISPDKQWLVARAPVQEEDRTTAVFLYPLAGGPRIRVCDGCLLQWSPDGKTLYIGSLREMAGPRFVAIRLRPGSVLPPMPSGGFKSEKEWAALGTEAPKLNFVPSPDPAVYAYTVVNTHSNLYRILLPQ